MKRRKRRELDVLDFSHENHMNERREIGVERASRRKQMIRRRRRRRQICMRVGAAFLIILFLILAGINVIKKVQDIFGQEYVEKEGEDIERSMLEIDVQLLTINEYSRPGTESKKIKGIVIHYTANPGSTAMQNRNYFEGLKDSHETQASSHFIVGLDGEIVQCVPTWEIAYASNKRNIDTVSIETCHETADGSYNKATYKSMVELTAWLCKKFDLTEDDVIRHYDVTGKICPKYFVENENAWEAFKNDVGAALDKI